MFEIKSIEILVKFSRIIIIPFFVIANLIEGNRRFPELSWLTNNWGNLGLIIWVFIIFIIVSISYSLIDALYCELAIKISAKYIFLWSGLFFITLGLLYFLGQYSKDFTSPFNMFWHLGFFCQGIRFLELS